MISVKISMTFLFFSTLSETYQYAKIYLNQNERRDFMKYPNLLERFLTYVKVNTRSDETSTTTPSTQSQVDFAKNVLIPEMKRVGLENVYYLPNGFAIGTLPANDPSFTRKIGFISHMDTADFNAENIQPQVIENYDGGVIPLGQSGFNLDPEDFASLRKYKGQTLITTDGTTLLGADDKSGIAEIMTAIEYLSVHPEIKHGEIRVGFGPVSALISLMLKTSTWTLPIQ